jgi:hypothetical protein
LTGDRSGTRNLFKYSKGPPTVRTLAAERARGTFSRRLNRVAALLVVGFVFVMPRAGAAETKADIDKCVANRPHPIWWDKETKDTETWRLFCSGMVIEHISQEFFEEILFTEEYLSRTPLRQVYLTKVKLPRAHIDVEDVNLGDVTISDSEFRSLHFKNVSVKENFTLRTSKITDDIRIENSKQIRNLVFSGVTVPAISIQDSAIATVVIQSWNGSDPSGHPTSTICTRSSFDGFIVDTQLDRLVFDACEVRASLEIVSHLGVARLRSLEVINGTRVAGALDLSNTLWASDSSLKIDYSSARSFVMRNALPRRIVIRELDIKDWDLGNDGIERFKEVVSGHRPAYEKYSPGLYTRVAQIYKEKGQTERAREVTYERSNEQYHETIGLERFLQWLSWVTVGYGLYPERGFIGFAILIILGYVIFSIRPKLSGKVHPRSWFVFSIDSAIPIINLDDKHKEISFADWRQYFLYLMRALSGILAFLVFKFLEKAITGE